MIVFWLKSFLEHLLITVRVFEEWVCCLFQMESELERFHKQNTQLELNITELRQKLKATDKEMHQERQKVLKQSIQIVH